MNLTNPFTMNAVLAEFEGVVYSCLQKLSISKYHTLYDDLLQIGRMTLIDAAIQSNRDPFLKENRYAFINYAATRIRWALVNELRREQRAQTPYKYAASQLSSEAASQLEAMIEQDWLMDLDPFLQSLSKQERNYFVARYHSGESITEIARNNGVSRKTVYAWQKKTQEKSNRYLPLHPTAHSPHK